MTKQLSATQPQTNAHPVEVEAELAQLLLVQRLDSVQRVLRQRCRPLQRRQALVRLSRSRNMVSVHAMRMESARAIDGQALVGLACQGSGGMEGLRPNSRSRSPHNQAHRFCRHSFKSCEWSLSSSAALFYHVIVDFYHLQELGVVGEELFRGGGLLRQLGDILHVHQGLAQVPLHHAQQLYLVVVLYQRRALLAQLVDRLHARLNVSITPHEAAFRKRAVGNVLRARPL